MSEEIQQKLKENNQEIETKMLDIYKKRVSSIYGSPDTEKENATKQKDKNRTELWRKYFKSVEIDGVFI